MPQTIGQGGTITLSGEYRTGAGTLIDPTTPLVDIINPSNVEVLSNAVPVKDGVGLYHYNYAVPSGAPLGLWTAHWTGVINGVAVSGNDVFEVVGAGEVGFEPGTLVSVEEVEGLAGVTLTEGQRQVMTTLLLDWTAELEERLNRSLSVKTFTNELVKADAAGRLWPRHMPVVSITAVRTSDGTTLSGTIGLGPGGGIELGYGAAGSYYVDYTAGMSETAARPVRSILLARAARMAVKMHDNGYGVAQLSQEGYTAPYLNEGWTDQELQNIDRRRRRVVRVG